MFAIAHISDPHVPSELDLRWRDLFNKRVIGFLSWTLRRRRIHRRSVLDLLAQDLRRQRCDHIVVTGDLANIALPSEFAAVASWLSQLGSAVDVSAVPGNHDAYVHVENGWAPWSEYMTGDELSGSAAPPVFPYLRRRAGIALLGLSTAIATGPGVSAGKLGRGQRERLRELLRRAREQGLFRLLFLHHPPAPTSLSKRKGLRDGEALRAILAEEGAELVLHGHDHRFRFRQIASRWGAIPVIGAPSASARAVGGGAAARYHIYRMAPTAHGWTLDVASRALIGEEHGFHDHFHFRLALPRSRRPLASPSEDPLLESFAPLEPRA